MQTNNTPDFVFQQAYDELARDRVQKHYVPKDHGTPHLISAIYSPIKPNSFRHSLVIEAQGKFFAAAIHYETKQPAIRGKRSAITDFSPASRKRLFDLFHRLEIVQKPVFLTLDYGADYPDAKTAKNNLRAFLERVRRKYPQSSAVWRLEFQERGAPHFHLIFFNLPFWKKESVQAVWNEVIGHPGERIFTRIEMIHSHKGLMAYVSKYVAKVNPGENSGFNSLTYLHAYQAKYGDIIGRVWGTFNRDNLPFAERTVIELPLEMRRYGKFKEIAALQFPPIADYRSPGFRLYVRDAKRWLDIFHSIYDQKF